MTTQTINSMFGTFEVEIVKGVSITVNGNRFKIGDQAEYDSYNFSYYGTIRKITEKTVTIELYPDDPDMSKTYRLRIDQFAWRNKDFDLEATQKRNFEVSMYI